MVNGECEDYDQTAPMQTDYVEFVQHLRRTMREWRKTRQLFPPKMFTLFFEENDAVFDKESGFARGRESLFVVPMEL